MTKTEMLLVRACKSLNSTKRIESVYRRFYCKTSKEERHIALVNILSSLVDKYSKPTTIALISALNQYQYIYSNVPKTYEGYIQIVLATLVNNLRFVETSKLPEDFIKPLQFRRNDD